MRRANARRTRTRRPRLKVESLEPRIQPADQPLQFFYLPYPEAPMRQMMASIASPNSISNDLVSITSIVASTDNTVIYYDHWEGTAAGNTGYEADLGNPTQPSTQVWGDNNPANGLPPGYAVDVINSGDIITLQNTVAANPRDPGVFAFEGGDKFGSSQSTAVTRANWPVSPGALLADASEVFDTRFYGTRYTAPVGENVVPTLELFQFSAFFVMAARDNATIQVDHDGDATPDVTTVLNQGGSYTTPAATVLNAGATVISDKPVQVHLVTGDVGATYESRYFTLLPDAKLASDYYSPVGSVNTADPYNLFIHNPTGTTLTVNVEDTAGITPLSIPANTTVRHIVTTLDSATHVWASGGQTFSVIGAMDVDATASGSQARDWGRALQPTAGLSPVAVVAWAPGNDGTAGATENGSPIWVTVEKTTTVYADFDGDPTTGANVDPLGNRYDVSFLIPRLGIQRIYDTVNNDRDQTGTRIYTADGTLLSAAWGQDPLTASVAAPAIDAGYAVPAFPTPILQKSVDFAPGGDANGDGRFNSGDTLRHSITIINRGLYPILNSVVADALPADLGYVPGSTTLDTGTGPTPVGDDPAGTPFPLDDERPTGTNTGFTIANIPVGATPTVSFDVRINPNLAPGTASITNSADVRIRARAGARRPHLSGDRVDRRPRLERPQRQRHLGRRRTGPRRGDRATAVRRPGRRLRHRRRRHDRRHHGGRRRVFRRQPARGKLSRHRPGRPARRPEPDVRPGRFRPGRGRDGQRHRRDGRSDRHRLRLHGGPGTRRHRLVRCGRGRGAGRGRTRPRGRGRRDPVRRGRRHVRHGRRPGISEDDRRGRCLRRRPPARGRLPGVGRSGRPPAGTVPTFDPDGIATPNTTTLNLSVSNRAQDFGYTGTGSVGGRIWNDGDNGGDQDAGEPGLNGVTVRLTGAGPDGQFGTADDLFATATTAGDGNYHFPNLPAGDFRIAVDPAMVPANVVPTFDPDGTLDQQTTVTLAAGEARAGIDFGYSGTGSIAGRVYVDQNLSGGFDAGEAGIANVRVRLTGRATAGADVSLETFALADGTFLFAGLEPGTYRVAAEQPAGYLDKDETVGGLAGQPVGTLDGNDAIRDITLAAGQNLTGYAFGDLTPAAIRGFVYRDANNDGIKQAGDAVIRDVRITLTGTDDRGAAVTLTTQTDATGRYAFDNLRPGTYAVAETQPGVALDGQETLGTPAFGAAATVNDRFTGFVLPVGGVSDGNNFGKLPLGTRLDGRVYVDRNNNGRKDPDEVGIPGVVVRLTGTDDQGQSVKKLVTTNAAGRYMFLQLRPGTHILIERHPTGYRDGRDTAGTLGGLAGNDSIRQIVLPVGTSGTGYNFGERGLGTAAVSKRLLLWGMVSAPVPGTGKSKVAKPGIGGGIIVLP